MRKKIRGYEDVKEFLDGYKPKEIYGGYPKYIIGSEEENRHLANLIKFFSSNQGVRIRVTFNMLDFAEGIIKYFLCLGLESDPRKRGKLITTNNKTGDDIYCVEIVLEKNSRWAL